MGLKDRLANTFDGKNPDNDAIIQELNTTLTEDFVSDYIVYLAEKNRIQRNCIEIGFYVVLKYTNALKVGTTNIDYQLTDDGDEPEKGFMKSRLGSEKFSAYGKSHFCDTNVIRNAIKAKFSTFDDFNDLQVTPIVTDESKNTVYKTFEVRIKNPLNS